jgi:coatomer protein complex subunit gamma
VILENATIRASAVSALAKFGSLCPGLLPHILQLLRRCLYDNDDEVRDRAAFCLSSLQKRSSRDSTNYENEKPYSIASMESALFRYLDVSNEVAFDVSAIERTEASPFAFGCEDSALANQAHRGISPSIDQDILNSQESVLNLPEFVKFGPIFKVRGQTLSCKGRVITSFPPIELPYN